MIIVANTRKKTEGDIFLSILNHNAIREMGKGKLKAKMEIIIEEKSRGVPRGDRKHRVSTSENARQRASLDAIKRKQHITIGELSLILRAAMAN